MEIAEDLNVYQTAESSSTHFDFNFSRSGFCDAKLTRSMDLSSKSIFVSIWHKMEKFKLASCVGGKMLEMRLKINLAVGFSKEFHAAMLVI